MFTLRQQFSVSLSVIAAGSSFMSPNRPATTVETHHSQTLLTSPTGSYPEDETVASFGLTCVPTAAAVEAVRKQLQEELNQLQLHLHTVRPLPQHHIF